MRMKLFAVAAAALLPLSALADQCPQPCGKVVDIDHYEKEGKGSGLGAVAGGVAGGLLGNQIGGGTGKTLATIGGVAGGAYVGNEVEKKSKSKKMQKVTVAMDHGGTQTFHMGEKAGFNPGARVQVVDGKLRLYAGR